MSTLLTDLLRACNPRDPAKSGRSLCGRAADYRVLRTACDYVEAQLCDPIRMDALCKTVGVSVSRLERLFRTELQMTPTAYIRARRLAAVRSELLDGDPMQRRVCDVAMDYGFNHLGRFSAWYRRQFGELPSETLTRPGGRRARVTSMATPLRTSN